MAKKAAKAKSKPARSTSASVKKDASADSKTKKHRQSVAIGKWRRSAEKVENGSLMIVTP